MTDFSKSIDLNNKKIETSYKGKKLVLLDPYKYDGPITLQLLPYGGIQSTYCYHIIIYTLDGFIACDLVCYDGIIMTSKEFIEKEKNLVNHVLPS